MPHLHGEALPETNTDKKFMDFCAVNAWQTGSYYLLALPRKSLTTHCLYTTLP